MVRSREPAPQDVPVKIASPQKDEAAEDLAAKMDKAEELKEEPKEEPKESQPVVVEREITLSLINEKLNIILGMLSGN